MVQEAQAADTYVMAHAYESRAVRRCVEAGARSIEHGNLIDRSTADLMASRGTYLVPTMTVFQALKHHGADLGLSKMAMGQLAELTKSAVDALELARSAGVKIGHGSDLEGILHQYQSEEFGLKARVMTPMETIVAATATNAELMGMNGQLGVIAPGALADIVVIDGNPLTDLSLLGEQGAHMSLIMKDGVIYKDRVLS
jgi:imidazolonepropionase-like amidohydrolase